MINTNSNEPNRGLSYVCVMCQTQGPDLISNQVENEQLVTLSFHWAGFFLLGRFPASAANSSAFLFPVSCSSGLQCSTARITAALCDVTSEISKKTSDKSVLILVSKSQPPRSCWRRRRRGKRWLVRLGWTVGSKQTWRSLVHIWSLRGGKLTNLSKAKRKSETNWSMSFS